jgi:hypothetical protein
MYVCEKGFLTGGVGRFPGVVGFSFSGLMFLILFEAFEGSLPRPGGMVDGKFFFNQFEGKHEFVGPTVAANL